MSNYTRSLQRSLKQVNISGTSPLLLESHDFLAGPTLKVVSTMSVGYGKDNAHIYDNQIANLVTVNYRPCQPSNP